MLVFGIDPGYQTGAISVMARDVLISCASLPGTAGTIWDRVDSAAAWFCEQIDAALAFRVNDDEPALLSLEDQHQAAFGSSQRHSSSANTLYVRDVIGGIRQHCYHLGIPVRMITPIEWRTRLGVPRGGDKLQAWTVVTRLHPEVGKLGTNEHKRDSAVICHVGSIAAHLWLMEWKRTHKGAA